MKNIVFIMMIVFWVLILVVGISAQDQKFDNILFLGDSLTVGIDSAVGLKEMGADIEAKIGRSVYECFKAAQNYKNYKTVVISIGTNDYSSDDGLFRNNFSKLIERVMSNNPKAKIYVNTIPGCNETVAREKGYSISNEKIDNKNNIIKDLAASYKVLSIDINKELGAINPEDTIDGIHMKEHIYKKWYDILSPELIVKKKVFVLSFKDNKEEHITNLKNTFEHYFTKTNDCKCSICDGGQ
jgi:lysophospholipase L1-like esterase